LITLAAFVLASATFNGNTRMPRSTVYQRCGGTNVSPELHWSGAPSKTRSFALIVHDPDAKAPGGWYHWVVYNLPGTTRELPGSARLADWQLGETSFGENAYGGPCPPPGKAHHYIFTLYALDVGTVVGAHLTGSDLARAIQHHTLAHATLIGLYSSS
jgi:Raf kinase inhibitor-like YbhB/YbcL family protein